MIVPLKSTAIACARAGLGAALVTACANALASRCDWSQPGARDYRGEVPAAVDAYHDIPAATRTTLKARMAAREYDDLVVIRRNSITGAGQYAPEIRDMHWRGGVCRGPVSRSAWPASAAERGLVYCEAGHCIVVPTVCRNVARIQRLAAAPASAQRSGGGGATGAFLPADGPIEITPSAGYAGPGLRLQVDLPLIPLQLPAWQPLMGATAEPMRPVLEIGSGDSPAPADAERWRVLPRLAESLASELLPPVVLPAPVPPIYETPTWALMSIGAAAVFVAARRRHWSSHA